MFYCGGWKFTHPIFSSTPATKGEHSNYFSDRIKADVYHYLPGNPLLMTTLGNVIVKLPQLTEVVIKGTLLRFFPRSRLIIRWLVCL